MIERGARLRTYAVPVLMSVIAALQFWLAQMHALSPWKGAGFGMFSTVDSPGARFLRVSLVTHGSEVRVPLPRQVAPLVAEEKTWPTDQRLRAIAERLALGTWATTELQSPNAHYHDLFSRARGSDSIHTRLMFAPQQETAVMLGITLMQGDNEPPPRHKVPFDFVRVELWKAEFDSPSRFFTARRLQDISCSAPAEPRPPSAGAAM